MGARPRGCGGAAGDAPAPAPPRTAVNRAASVAAPNSVHGVAPRRALASPPLGAFPPEVDARCHVVVRLERAVRAGQKSRPCVFLEAVYVCDLRFLCVTDPP